MLAASYQLENYLLSWIYTSNVYLYIVLHKMIYLLM
jgi:hypothetical protein